MAVSLLGALSLGWFFVLMLASVQQWIPQRALTFQSVLLIGALLLLGLALLFGVQVHVPVLLTATTLNPITATIAGFLLAGAVEAAGGFAAAGTILVRLSRGFFGLSGTIVLLVNSPTIFAMPCGRVWAAALMPAALVFGAELARRHGNPVLLPIILFGLVANAAASCGPSPLGGIGMMGEGMGGFLQGSFVKPQQFAIMAITLATMVAMGLWHGIGTNSEVLKNSGMPERKLPKRAYYAFFFYVLSLAAMFVLKPPVPIQTILLGITMTVMIMGRVGLNDLIAGLILHPITAMIAGFIMAGALVITGAFDTLVCILSVLALHTPLGHIGVSILLVYVPIILPMPCGRVMVAALLPGVIMFGREVAEMTKHPEAFSGLVVAFILSCAASCVSSPLGGIGAMAEGNLGIKQGIAIKPLQLGILLGVPVASLIATSLGISAEIVWVEELFASLGLGLFFGATTNLLLGEPFYRLGGFAGGLLSVGLMWIM